MLKRVLAFLFHWGMILWSLGTVFSICGALFYLWASSSSLSQLTRTEIPWVAWGQFCLGGTVGVGGIIFAYFRKIDEERPAHLRRHLRKNDQEN